MQLVSMCKMIVLIILPVPFEQKVDRNTGQYPFLQNQNDLHIEKAPHRLNGSIRSEHWTFPFFVVVGTSGKTMAFFLIHLYLYYMASSTFWTVLIQLELKEGKRPLKPGFAEAQKDAGGRSPSWTVVGWAWMASTIARWCWPRLRETVGRDGRSLPPPRRRTWWVAQIASSGSCLVLCEKRTPQNISGRKGDTNMGFNVNVRQSIALGAEVNQSKEINTTRGVC